MLLFDIVFNGNDTMYKEAEDAVNAAVAQYGEDMAVGFPDTAYSLAIFYAETGKKITTLKEAKEALVYIKSIMTRERRLHDGFMSGVATAMSAELIEAMKYINGATPYEAPYEGHMSDAQIRELGVPLVTGDIPGIPVIINAAPTTQEAVDLVKSYQSQGNFVCLIGGICEQLKEAGYKTGFNVRVYPIGDNISCAAHAVSAAVRTAMIFGNIEPGDKKSITGIHL